MTFKLTARVWAAAGFVLCLAACDRSPKPIPPARPRPVPQPAAAPTSPPEQQPGNPHIMPPPVEQPSSPTAKVESGRLIVKGVAMDVASSWKQETPASSMRAAQFSLPGDAGDADVVVSWFGPGGAGQRDANVQRWIDQFSDPDRPDKPAAATTKVVTQDGLTLVIVQVSGTYAAGIMSPVMGADAEPRKDYAMYGIILEGGPEGTLYVKATGPKATIQAHQAELDRFASGATKAKS